MAMTNEAQRKRALDDIRDNIARSGQHIYVVSGDNSPRFAYTIGLSESIGVELILAGAIVYMKDEVLKVINDFAMRLKAHRDQQVFKIAGLGSFTLRKAHSSWTTELMLGALDYYAVRDIPTLQIVPDKAHWTIDVPNLSAAWNASTEPVWRWLKEPWTFPVPRNSMAATNLAALRGGRITEVVRWENDYWEVFAGAGPDVTKDETRVVPLGTLVATDDSLVPVVSLALGEGLWRDAGTGSEWHPWRKRQQETMQ